MLKPPADLLNHFSDLGLRHGLEEGEVRGNGIVHGPFGSEAAEIDLLKLGKRDLFRATSIMLSDISMPLTAWPVEANTFAVGQSQCQGPCSQAAGEISAAMSSLRPQGNSPLGTVKACIEYSAPYWWHHKAYRAMHPRRSPKMAKMLRQRYCRTCTSLLPLVLLLPSTC